MKYCGLNKAGAMKRDESRPGLRSRPGRGVTASRICFLLSMKSVKSEVNAFGPAKRYIPVQKLMYHGKRTLCISLLRKAPERRCTVFLLHLTLGGEFDAPQYTVEPLFWSNARSVDRRVPCEPKFFQGFAGFRKVPRTCPIPATEPPLVGSTAEKAQPPMNFAHFRVVTRTSTPAVANTKRETRNSKLLAQNTAQHGQENWAEENFKHETLNFKLGGKRVVGTVRFELTTF